MQDIELGHVKRLIIGYEDRFVRIGYDWFESFCERHGTEIVVTNGDTKPYDAGQGWSVPVTENLAKSYESRYD